jgi:hypothetical protein
MPTTMILNARKMRTENRTKVPDKMKEDGIQNICGSIHLSQEEGSIFFKRMEGLGM